MRLITIRTPEGDGRQVADLAFSLGIKEVSISVGRTFYTPEQSDAKDVVDIETATPVAHNFIDALNKLIPGLNHPENLMFVGI